MLNLDVGCGSKPRGKVNIDLLIADDEWNPRETALKDIPNFVKADAHYLPFRSRVFAEVMCFHLLEHVNSPMRVLREMKRVAHSSLLIVIPYWLFDTVYGLFHPSKRRWLKAHHKHRLTRRQIRLMLEKLGYTRLESRFRCVAFMEGLKGRIKYVKFGVPCEILIKANGYEVSRCTE